MRHPPDKLSHDAPAGALPIVVVGGGVGSLCAALRLATAGEQVVLLEGAGQLGGKAAGGQVGKRAFDLGPTVLTLPAVFAEIFAAAGGDFFAELQPQPLAVLAQHMFADGSSVALHREAAHSREAIGDFAGAAAARGFDRFCRYTAALYALGHAAFMQGPKPTPRSIWQQYGLRSLALLSRIDAHRSMMRALRDFFVDPRLHMLFGRYATYAGGSPYATPATFNLIAHVEQAGVYTLSGGMHTLPQALGRHLVNKGGTVRLHSEVVAMRRLRGDKFALHLRSGEQLFAAAVIWGGTPAALPAVLGARPVTQMPPALSAWTWAAEVALTGRASAALAHHNVFFTDDYAAEFNQVLGAGRMSPRPTLYVCAQDRLDSAGQSAHLATERLFCLANAPSVWPGQPAVEEEPCLAQMLAQLRRSGLQVQPQGPLSISTPQTFARRYPHSHGAVYGTPPHSWLTCWRRPGSRSRYRNLYICGGGSHPGPGLPMVALSGNHAAAAVLADLPSIRRCRVVAMPGGTSMPRATTVPTP